MARVGFCGYDAKDSAIDFGVGTGTGVSYDSSIVHTAGGSSLKVIAQSGSPTVLSAPVGASAEFHRVYIRLTALPTTNNRLIVGDASSNMAIRIRPDGKLQYGVNGVLGTGVNALTDTTHFYCIEFRVSALTSNIVRFRVDGVDDFSTTAATNDYAQLFGPGDSVADTYTAYFDDYTADNADWCGPGNVALLLPASDNSVGSGWTTSGGASTGLSTNVDNTPPTGIADTTANAGHQIRNASSASASYVANLATYASAGIAAGDTINAVRSFVAVGAPVSTSAKTGSQQLTANPAAGSATAFAANTGDYWTGTAAGTYVTGWKVERAPVITSPSVTVGNNPTLSLNITGGTASRIAMCCAMGMYVDYTPATAVVAAAKRVIQAVGNAFSARRWVGFALAIAGQTGTTPALTGAPRETITAGVPITRPWMGYAKLSQPAIRGTLVFGAPRDTIKGAIPITRPWVGYARILTPVIRGPLVTGIPRDTIKAGLGNGVPIVRWAPYGAQLRSPSVRGPLVTGSPRTVVRGAIPIARRWTGFALVLHPAIEGALVSGAPRETIFGRVPIVRSVMRASLVRSQPGVAASTTGSPRETILGRIPPARRSVGYALVLRPAIRGDLVTGAPRETIKAGLGNGLAITRWAPYGAFIRQPAIRGALLTGPRRSAILGAAPIARPRVAFARLFTHALGGKVTPGQVTIAHGTPIAKRWTGFALVARPAIRGTLVTGSPRGTIRASVPITLSRVAFSPAARVFEPKAGIVAGTTGAPRSTLLGRLPITRRWTGFAIVSRPAIRGSLVTGSPRDTILGKIPIVRPWVGYARILKPAIRGALVAGSPRESIIGRVAITRPWVGTTSVTHPAIRGDLVTGSPRDTIRGAVPITRRWVGFALVLRPAIRGRLVSGAPRETIVGRVQIARASAGGTGFGVTQTGPQLGIAAATNASLHRTIAGGVPIASIVVRRQLNPYGLAIDAQPAIQGRLVTGSPRDTIKGSVPIVRAWPGVARVYGHAIGGRLVAGSTTSARGVQLGSESPERAASAAYLRRLFRAQIGTTSVAHRLIAGGLTPPRVFSWSNAVTQPGGQTGIIFGAPRRIVVGALAIVRPWFGTDRRFAGLAGTAFHTPHHMVSGLEAFPRADAELHAFPRVGASLATLPRVSAQLTINGSVIMSIDTCAAVRIHASNVVELTGLTDLLDSGATFTSVAITVRIVRKDGSELTATTSVPVSPTVTGRYATTLSKTLAPFELDKIYRAQFSGTMKDADLNDVDYYEELELIGAAR